MASTTPYGLTDSCEIRFTFEEGTWGLELAKKEYPHLAFACTIDDPSRRNAVGWMLFGERIEAFASTGWPVRHVEINRACDPNDWAARVAVQCGSRKGNVLLPMKYGPLLMAAEGKLAAVSTGRLHAGLPDVPLRPRLRLGFQDVPLVSLRQLRRGDVLLGALRALGRPAVGCVHVLFDVEGGPGYGLRCFLKNGVITMEHGQDQVSCHEDGEEGQPVLDEFDLASPVPLNDLALRVQVELELQTMKLSELASIAPGHVIELKRPLEHAGVDLRINGQVWARGELVAVGQQLGVRVLSIGAQHVPAR